ncbi:YggT family protein [Luteipulveratus sp. YIM 133132]|uniref:YggT family protein n=1 Tax=Luteipulveratus flavus TaxID=3031728 RepID=A0ABT6C640_9MICO|nr:MULTISPECIES: YggT family protein [unclassified Luteipulveratus]MDE9366476.1 YggT family protein [Luteipulveratus sp. YIM 133132]MDF8264250.1 YggT family protein [Luteipulveratus sp. YIM 133296]
MNAVRAILALLLYLFFIVLIARLVLDWVQVLAREWRPRGPILVLAEVVYSITDPPLRALRRIIPPLRLGQVRLDLAFLVLVLAVSFLLRLLR